MNTQTKNLASHGRHRAEGTGAITKGQPHVFGFLSLRGSRARHARPNSVTTPASAEANVQPQHKERFSEQAEVTRLVNDDLPLSNRKPLLEGDAVQKWTGLPMGPLQAVIHPAGNSPRILCFDRSIRNQDGRRIASYLFVTDEQLQNIQNSEATGSPSQESIKKEALLLKLDRPQVNRRQVVGQNHPMPGDRVRGGMIYNEYGVLSDKSLAGETVLSINPNDYQMLSVRDIGSQEGTVVEHSAELITPQDPWAGSPTSYTPVYPRA